MSTIKGIASLFRMVHEFDGAGRGYVVGLSRFKASLRGGHQPHPVNDSFPSTWSNHKGG